MATEELLYEIKDGIGRITFNRPGQRNALTFAMYEGMADICANIPEGGSVKAIIVEGAGGKAFAAGTDMSQFRAFETAEDAWAYEVRIEEVLEAIETCKVPTIAAINGACTGGGAGIALACDLRVATASLNFGFPIARTLGNCLSIANLSRLSALIGPARVRELIFMARLVQADEAQALGLVSEILPDAGRLEARVIEMAETLKAHAPLTLRATKEALRRLRTQGPAAEDSDLVALCYTSQDFKEGMEAFLAKRRPNWQGK